MTDIVMPQLGESVTEGTITRWFKAVGDPVAEDEPLFEVSTDKVDTEVPAPAGGVLTEIRVAEGDTVDVGTLLAVLDGAGGAAAPAAPAPEAAPAPAPAPAPVTEAPAAPAPAPVAPAPVAPAPAPAPVAETPAPPAPAAPAPVAPAPAPVAPAPAAAAAGGALLSPLVRRLIEEHGLDASRIPGTGVGGRITREDVFAAIDAGTGAAPAAAAPAAPAPAAPAPAPAPAAAPAAAARPVVSDAAPMHHGAGDRVVELNKIRQVTGEHMVASKAISPHAVTIIEVDFEGVDRVRRAVRDQFRAEEGFSLTYLPFVSRAVVDALHEFPRMNAAVDGGSLIIHNEVHLAIAVDLNYEGLLAPVVAGAHEKRLAAIAADIHDLAERARSRRLAPDELSGGTFTISNSGSYGTAVVIPIINQPQVAILSTDGVSRKPVVVTDANGGESLAIHSVGNLTLAWDHRAFDGAYAAAFMAKVAEIIETRDWATEL